MDNTVYFNLYYSTRCGYCIEPKKEFLKLPAYIMVGPIMVKFQLIDIDSLDNESRQKITHTPTYLFIVKYATTLYTAEYQGKRDYQSILVAARDQVKAL